jgi:hypothetical protein
MADRVALRDVTESMKARFLNEYSDTLTLPRDANGRPMFPSEPNQVSKIGRAGMETDDDVIAARSLVDYINMIENVQSTFLDRIYQSAFRLFADAIEGSGESAIRQKIGAGARAAGRVEPIREAKLLAFKVYLASNPPRQVLVQSHQISQLTIRDPVRAADVLFTQFPAILALKAGQDLGLVSKQFAVSEDSLKRILKEWDESGIGQGVDSNMLVDGSVKAFERDLVANPVAKVGSTALKTINAPFRAGQVLGFNAGEYAQQMMHWLFQRQKWIDENPNMLPGVDALDTIAAETAMTTYNMNRSGKMKYQDGLLGVLLQFLTVGHRAGLSMTTNKALTRGERIRLGIGNLALYGTQTMPIVGHITEEIVTSIAEKNGYELTQEERDLMQYGLEEAGWKALIEWWTGESFDSDLVGSLAPGSYSGWMDIIDKIMSKELLEWGFGPAGSFMPFSEGSKPAKVWTQLRVLFGDEQTSTVDKTTSTLDILGKNFFGAYSNITQALLALEDGKLKSNTNGTVLVDDVTTPEAIALAVGIRPRRGQEAYKARKEVADRANALRSDVRKYLQAIHAVFDSANPESVPDTLNRFARIMTDVWGQDPDVQYDVQVMLMEELKKELRKDPANSAINKLLQYHNLFSTEEVLRKLHVLGMPKEAIADWQAVIKNARVGMAEQDVPPSGIKSYGPITVDQRNK